MKATHYYKETMGCCKMQISFWITPEDIKGIIANMMIDNLKITKTKVEEEIRTHLMSGGRNYFDYGMWDNADHYNADMEKAEEIAKKLFPDFWNPRK